MSVENEEAESILSAFSYEDYEDEDEFNPQPTVGDFVYASREVPPSMAEQGFYARIVMYSNPGAGIGNTPALLCQSKDDPDGEYESILNCLFQGYTFSKVPMTEYLAQMGKL